VPIRRALHLLVPIALASSCSSGNQSSGSTVDDETFMTRFCELTEACCGANGALNLDPSLCKQELQILGFSRDGNLRAACLQGLTKRAPDESCFPELSNLEDPCVRTFNEPGGSSPPGGPCRTTVDCAGTAGAITMCWENTAGSGVCMRMSPGREGQGTCLGDVETTSGGGFFGPFLGPGASGWPPEITDGVYCDQRAGLTCFLNSDLSAQVCGPLLADGAACSFGFNCASQSCMDPTSGMEPTVGRTGACKRRAVIGQSCSALTVTCDSASYCRESGSGVGQCVPKLSKGASCTSEGICASGNCQSLTTCSAIPLTSARLFCH
jgi:hypothetical protein